MRLLYSLTMLLGGLPVLVAGCGPVLDYCADETAYLLPARELRLPAIFVAVRGM